MRNCHNGNVSYRLLRKLLERAWDEGDTNRAMLLSQTMDEANVALIARENRGRKCQFDDKKTNIFDGKIYIYHGIGLVNQRIIRYNR